MSYYIPILLSLTSNTNIGNLITTNCWSTLKFIGKKSKLMIDYMKPVGLDYQETDFDFRDDEVSLQEGAKAAIEKIQQSIALIESKEGVLSDKIRNALRDAFTKNKLGNKKSALFALKRKKLYELEYERLESIHNGLIMKTMNLETMLINLEIYATLKVAANQMKTINNGMSTDTIDDALDDIHESINIADEISNILSQPITPEIYDEDELLEELNNIDIQDLQEPVGIQAISRNHSLEDLTSSVDYTTIKNITELPDPPTHLYEPDAYYPEDTYDTCLS